MARATEAPLDIGSILLKEEEISDEPEDSEANGERETTSANAVDAVESEGSKVAMKKNKKKKKKKKGSGEKRPMPTQALVDLSFPWKATNKSNVGRCAIASRAIKAGEIVVAEQAVAFIPRSQDRLVVCHRCCKDVSPPKPSYECTYCHYSVFCVDCDSVIPRLQHNRWCHVLGRINEIAQVSDCDKDLLHFVLALALQRQPDTSDPGFIGEGDSKEGTVRNGTIYSSYQDAICLQSHIDKVPAKWRASVRKGCQLLHDEAVKENGAEALGCTVDDLENLAALVNTNSHGMGAHGSGIHNADVAVGIFPFVSMLNHSCRPNCCFASDGRVMYVRATQDIFKDTELCLSYINLYEPRVIRKMQLAETKHFLCRCQRCAEPFSSSIDRFLEGCICGVRSCGGLVVKSSSLHEDDHFTALENPASSWECDKCSRLLDPRLIPIKASRSAVDQPWLLITEAERKLAAAMSVYRERRFKDARTLLEQFVGEFTGKLHPLNVLLFDSLTPLMNCCRALGDAAEGSRVCRSILDCMEKVLPGISLELANFYFCLGEMYLERSEGSSSNVMIKRYRKLAQDTFRHVREIREICLGTATLPA